MADLRHITIVDDEERVLDALRRTLRPAESGWRLSFHQSGLLALEAAEREPPDVVVTDLRMPEQNGFELIAAMRRKAPHARYLILTGSGDFDTALSAINHAKAFRFLTKPCPTEELIAAISEALADLEVAQSPVAQSDAGAAHGLGALTLLPTAVIVVAAADASVVFANAAGQDLLSERDGLLVDEHQRLRAAEPLHTARLRAAIADSEVSGGEFVTASRPSQRADLSVAIAPLPPDQRAGAFVALVITDPEQSRAPAPQTLGKLFDLSATEARIALAIAEGLDMCDAAAAAGVTVSTARTYLKRAFAKTGTRRQAELVKIVLSAPLLRTPEGDRRSAGSRS